MYGLAVFSCSYIYIEVEGVFSIGIDTERQRTPHGAFDGLTVAKNLNETNSEQLRRIAEHYRKFHALK